MKKYIALFIAFVTVFSCTVVANAEEISMVTYTDGKSYEGLPEFPTVFESSLADGTKLYNKFNSYFLYYDESACLYALICSDAALGTIYKDSNNYFSSDSEVICYKDYECTEEYAIGSANFYQYYCGEGGLTWTFKSWTSYVSVAYTDKLLQASDNIYTDDTLTMVFIKPVEGLLISGMSSQTITKTLIATMVGFLPSVIGLLTLVTAFWMAYRLLRRELLMV